MLLRAVGARVREESKRRSLCTASCHPPQSRCQFRNNRFCWAPCFEAAEDWRGETSSKCALPLAFDLHVSFFLKSHENARGKGQHMLVKHLHREAKMTFLKLCHFSLIVVTFQLNELHRPALLVRMTCSPCVGMAASDPKPAKN